MAPAFTDVGAVRRRRPEQGFVAGQNRESRTGNSEAFLASSGGRLGTGLAPPPPVTKDRSVTPGFAQLTEVPSEIIPLETLVEIDDREGSLEPWGQ